MDPLLPIRRPLGLRRRVPPPGPSRWVLQLLRRSGQAAPLQGFAMVLVILAALMLAAGGLALANRASSGLLGSVFQGFSLEAREAAEIGMNRIIAELNKPTNRGMLRSRGTSDEKGLWNAAHLALFYRNKCPGTSAPDVSTGSPLATTLGYPQGSADPSSAYNQVFILPNGAISTVANGANRSYQLISVSRPAEAKLRIFADNSSPDNGQGQITLVVKGRALRPDGSVASEVVLQKVFQVVPKCCGTSFGQG